MMSDNVKMETENIKSEYHEFREKFNDLENINKYDFQNIKLKQQLTCDLCAKSFFLEQSLKYHQHIHTGLGLYNCEVCSATFTEAGN